MALIKPDFSEVSGAIQPGVYGARIKECEMKTSKAGNAYAQWKLELFGKPEVNNRIVFHRTPVTGKGAFRLQELYKAAIGEDLEKNEQFDTDSLVSKEVTVTLIAGQDLEGNPSQYPEVKAVSPYKQ